MSQNLVNNIFSNKKIVQFTNNFTRDTENGILQKFMEPKSAYEQMYRITWSNDLCTTEVISSRSNLNDKRVNIYERCNILSNNPRFSISNQVTSEIVPKSIEAIFHNVTKHVFQTSNGVLQIEGGTLYFKMCKNSKLWFHFSTDLKCSGTKAKEGGVFNQKLDINIPKDIDTTSTLIGVRKSNLKKMAVCYSCFERFISSKIYSISSQQYLECLNSKARYTKLYPSNEISDIQKNYGASKDLANQKANNNIFTFKFQDESTPDDDQKAEQIKEPPQNICSSTGYKPHPDKEKIPEVYRYFYPNITQKGFNEQKLTDDFKSEVITVCDQCYVDLFGFKLAGGNPVVNKVDIKAKLIGTGMLCPQTGVRKYLDQLSVSFFRLKRIGKSQRNQKREFENYWQWWGSIHRP